MSGKGDLDELFELKTNFYLGNYQGAINEAATLRQASPNFLKDVYVFRSYIALGDSSMVLAEVDVQNTQTPLELQAVHTLALIASGNKDDGASGLSRILELTGGVALSDTLLVLLGFGFLSIGRFEDALRYASQAQSLEARALTIQTLLAINRLDLAEKEWLKMRAIEEDAPLSQLAQAWLLVVAGGEKIREAVLIYQELIESYSPTPLLLNGLAICHIQSGNYQEAEKVLMSSLQKNSKDPETIINLLVSNTHHSKSVQSDVDKRLFRTLLTAVPGHRWLQGLQNKESIFDSISARYLPAIPSCSSST